MNQELTVLNHELPASEELQINVSGQPEMIGFDDPVGVGLFVVTALGAGLIARANLWRNKTSAAK